MNTQRSIGSGLVRPAMAVLFLAMTTAGCTIGNISAPTGTATQVGTAAAPVQADTPQAVLDAQRIGNTVAELQNKYRTIQPNESAKLGDNAKELGKFWVTDAKNAQVGWLSRPNVTWTFAPVTYTNTNLIDVLWLGKSDDTGELLAFATATYRSDLKQFGHATWGITKNAQNLNDGQKLPANPFPVTLTKSEPGPVALDKSLKGKDDAVATSLMSDATTWKTFKEYTAGRDKMQSVYGLKADDPFLTSFMAPLKEVVDSAGNRYNSIDTQGLNMQFVSLSTYVAQINDGMYNYLGLLAVETASADKTANATSYDVVTYLVDSSGHVTQIAIDQVSTAGPNTAGK